MLSNNTTHLDWYTVWSEIFMITSKTKKDATLILSWQLYLYLSYTILEVFNRSWHEYTSNSIDNYIFALDTTLQCIHVFEVQVATMFMKLESTDVCSYVIAGRITLFYVATKRKPLVDILYVISYVCSRVLSMN